MLQVKCIVKTVQKSRKLFTVKCTMKMFYVDIYTFMYTVWFTSEYISHVFCQQNL